MSLLESSLTWFQLAVLAPLAVFGLHRGLMVALWLRARRQRPAAPRAGSLPRVAVQLPIYNERYVAARLIEAAARLDYPRDRLEIQVLDDSDDDTPAIVRRTLAQLPADLRAIHLRRQDREGYKAGALAAGLRGTDAELVALFDADFVPPPGFLRDTVPWFDDPGVGMVQCRWEHLNAHTTTLTRVQALLLDGHFAVEHTARAHSGAFFNFNGTAGVFRRRCVEDAGGWQGDTLTEDLDLSYRAQLRGWRFVYRPDVACPAELPADANGFLNQQHRWAQGSIQTARKLLGRVWKAPLPAYTKLEATFHLLGNLAFPLLLLLILVALPLQLLRRWNQTDVEPWLALAEGLPLLFSTACVLLYYGTAEAALRRREPGAWLRIPLVLAAGAGLCLNNTLAVLAGLRQRRDAFERTPKFALRDRQPRPRRARYGAGRRPLAWLEIGLGLWATATAHTAWLQQLPATAAFHGLFATGLLWLGIGSLLAGATHRPAPLPAPEEPSAVT